VVRKQRRLDAIEALCFAALIGLVAFYVGTKYGSSPDPGRWLGEKYGYQKVSRNAEEWIIRDFFNDKRNGVFVDVGAADYKENSNTFFLETGLGWTGLAIDALPEFGDNYRRYRPKTVFASFFVSDSSDSQATLYVPVSFNREAASGTAAAAKAQGLVVTPKQVPTITLDDFLTKSGLDRFDFLSMDIELAEPKALAGFSIEKYLPSLVCIEAHSEVRQQILDYFAKHDYVLVGRYLRSDPDNLYFSPLTKK
jgi:FkbM family methyltransferase